MVPEPDAVKVCRWDTDPLFRGAYSFLPVGSLPDGFAALQEPIGQPDAGRIWLAGEACHSRYSGYLQGAYMSGEEVALKVAHELQGT